MTNDRRRILVVDDETQITRVLRTTLSAQTYDVRVANDGEMALEIMRDWKPHLVITDLAMPNLDGVGLCRRIRQTSQVPVIVLSVRGQDRVKVEALDAGANDFVTKPFSMNELLARVRAHLRMVAPAEAAPQLIEAGDFRIDLETRSVAVSGREIRSHSQRIRSADLPRTACRKSHHPSGAAGGGLGTEQYRATGIPARVCRPTAQEDRTGSLGAEVLAHRALGRLSLRTR